MERSRVGILVFDDVEVLDFCGPFEVFSVTRLDESRRREQPSPYDLRLVAVRGGAVTAAGGLRVLADLTLADCPPLDLLIVPGGWGTRRELSNTVLIDWIAGRARRTATVASVCTGALLLARAALLDGRESTTHRGALELLAELAPCSTVVSDRRVIDTGPVVTSAGIAAGIDMALALVARDHGEAIARNTARYMEYPYFGDHR